MASGSASTSRSSNASNHSAVVITCLQEMQVRLRRMEGKQGQLQASLDELRELMKASQESTFKVKGSPFQRLLEVKVAELFAKNILRSITAAEFRGVVTSVLRGSARDRYKVDAALKYCKSFLCTLKGEERRKVFGRKPYESARTLPTPELAKLILRQYSLTDEQIQCYTRHVALLRKFIRETPDSLAVDLHKKFAIWVNENGFSAPTEEDWNTIMEEDGSLGSTATTEQVATDYNSDDIIDDGLTDVPTDVPVTDTIMDLETSVLESGQLGSLMAEDIRRILS